MASEPTTYPNPRGDNAWDNDTVHWLLEQPGVADEFTRGVLMECLRRQPGQLRKNPDRVAAVEAVARLHGVQQRRFFDQSIGKDVVRLVRTDDQAPAYPW